jgi:hypothetical protein
MTVNARRRLLLRTMAAAGIVAGILSLLGIRPMNSRTIEVALGTASLVSGLVLFALTLRAKISRPPSIA